MVIYARGYKISRRTLKKEIPVYEENAVDDDLLNEGKRNLLDYLQTRGHFDAKVEILKETDAKTMQVIYQIDPGALHKLVLVEITGNKDFLDTPKLKSYLQIQPTSRLLSHGRYSETLLKGDVATLEALYRSSGFRQVKIETKVDDNYEGSDNKLAVHIHIEEGVRTRVGELHVLGTQKVPLSELPETSTQPGQPYSEQDLANDRERILSYYFDHGFPNASLEITTKPSDHEPNREDVTYTIQEGEHFTVNQVMVAGTEHTRDYVVQRELQVHAERPAQPAGSAQHADAAVRSGHLQPGGYRRSESRRNRSPEKCSGASARSQALYLHLRSWTWSSRPASPPGTTAPQGTTGVSPRVEFDVTRLNFGGRNQTLTFQSHVGRLQQRGLISYAIPKLFDNDKFKLIYTIFYDNSLDVATFTSQRLEGKIDLRQQIGSTGREPGTRPGPSSITYRFDFRRVKASNFADGFSPGEITLALSAGPCGRSRLHLYS